MIRIDSRSLMNEIRDAQKLRKLHLKMWRDVLRRMTGMAWREGYCTDPTPENYPFNYLTLLLPRLAARAPEVRIRPVRTCDDEPVAKGLTLAVEYWMREIDWKGRNAQIVRDAILGWGVSMVTLDKRGDRRTNGQASIQGDFQLEPEMPVMMRISPTHFLADAHAKGGVERFRIVGHEFQRDYDDLLKDERYDQDLVARLADVPMESAEDDDIKSAVQYAESERRRVKLYNLYLPEHGKIVTIGETGKTDGIIIGEHDYYGPDEGPYVLWGLYLVPDQVYPLSPLVACWEQFLDLTEHAVQMGRSAASHKKLGIYRRRNRKDALAVKKANPGDLVPVEDENAVKDFEIGGVSPLQTEYLAIAKERLDRNLALSDVQRGVPDARTATANQLAQNAVDIRIEWMTSTIEDYSAATLEKVVWYFVNDDGIQFNFSGVDDQTGEPYDAFFRGGPWDGGYVDNQFIPPQRPDMDAVDFSLEIKPRSMSRETDIVAQKRAQDEFLLLMQLQQMGMPVNWRRFLDEYGETFGKKNYSRILLLDTTGEMVPYGQYNPPPEQIPQFGPQRRPLSQLMNRRVPGLRSPETMQGVMDNAAVDAVPPVPPRER